MVISPGPVLLTALTALTAFVFLIAASLPSKLRLEEHQEPSAIHTARHDIRSATLYPYYGLVERRGEPSTVQGATIP